MLSIFSFRLSMHFDLLIYNTIVSLHQNTLRNEFWHPTQLTCFINTNSRNVFRAVHPAAENVDVGRMMGRWFQVINSPHVIREACTVTHCKFLGYFGLSSNFKRAILSASFHATKFFCKFLLKDRLKNQIKCR